MTEGHIFRPIPLKFANYLELIQNQIIQDNPEGDEETCYFVDTTLRARSHCGKYKSIILI